jgi:hypothetical protein
MNIQTFSRHVQELRELLFVLPAGHFVPRHFHITEVGLHTRHFLDCGGVERKQLTVVMQLWVANDYEHRLQPGKLLQIIRQTEAMWSGSNPEVEIEYQGQTIERYAVDIRGEHFHLQPLQTACLAPDQCGVDGQQKEFQAVTKTSVCKPGSGCC